MSTHQFQLVGGDAVLDFVNTVHDWTAPEPRDHLPTFAEALRFAEVAGVLTPAEGKRLAPMPPRTELGRLHTLRARLERILRAVLEERPPAAGDLEDLAREAAESARTVRWRSEKGRLTRAINPEAAGVATIRLRLVEAATALLTSDRLQRVSACPSCGWFFVDTTKNKSRRWCSMEMCGSAVKARSYYWRKKQRRSRSSR